MTGGADQDPTGKVLSATTIDLAIRLGFIGFLGYWSFRIVAPFITIGLWSVVLAVALHPLFALLALRLGSRAAATLVVLLCMAIVVGPLTWLGFGMASAAVSLVTALDSGQLGIPLPSEAIKRWPVVGERLHHLWTLAATNIGLVLTEVTPMLKPVGVKLLEIAQGALFGLFELIIAIVVAGFLFPRGPQLVALCSAFLGRVLSARGAEMVQLAGATIRNVSRGVVGISLLQALLAGMGFVAAGIPAAGVLAFIALVLGIIQVGPSILILPIIVWSWTAMEASHALAFTAYMIPVGLIDNVLRPLLMARGLATPMPVIMVGVIGGTLAYGIVGLFFGPIVLAVAWSVIAAWVQSGETPAAGNAPAATAEPVSTPRRE